jgi:ribose transport system permease protein
MTHSEGQVRVHRPARGFVTPLTVISIGVLVMMALAAVQTEGAVFSQSILSALTPLIGVMILAAAGQALVIGTGGIDLSVPAAITVTGIILTTYTDGDPSKLATAIIIVLIAVIAMGLVNGILVEVFGLNSLVVTLAVGLLAIGLGRLYRGKLLSVVGVPEPLVAFSGSNVAGVSFLLLASIALAGLATFFVWLTVPGRRLVASSASAAAGSLVGLRATAYRISAYAVAGVLYGIAGIMLSGLLTTPDLAIGEPYLLAPIVAVVLGGAVLTGGRVSFVATLLGAVFVSLLNLNLAVAGFTGGMPALVQGLVLALGLTLVFLLRDKRLLSRMFSRRTEGEGALQGSFH